MPSYASPTNTFLDKLDETKRSNSFGNGSHKLPAVFEIFITTYLLKLVSTIFNVPFGYIAKSLYRKGKIEQLDNGY